MTCMTVKELKEMLKDANDEDIIVLSSDSEGNNYSPLSSDYGVDNYLPEDSWYGEVYPRKLTKELIQNGYTEEDLGDDEDRSKMIKCITLYPMR